MAPDVSNLRPAYTIREDYAAGVIYVMIEGFFDVATLVRHFAEERMAVDRWRADGRPIKVLVDAVNLLPHSTEGQAVVQSSIKRIHRPGDRVALQVSSSLVKMQMRRSFANGNMLKFFLSNDAALMWLHAMPVTTPN